MHLIAALDAAWMHCVRWAAAHPVLRSWFSFLGANPGMGAALRASSRSAISECALHQGNSDHPALFLRAMALRASRLIGSQPGSLGPPNDCVVPSERWPTLWSISFNDESTKTYKSKTGTEMGNMGEHGDRRTVPNSGTARIIIE